VIPSGDPSLDNKGRWLYHHVKHEIYIVTN
jgi:hypothetical protein